MSDLVIRAENLSKQYRIGAKQEKYKTLRDTLAEAAKTPLRALQTLSGHQKIDPAEKFWALKDVSFEVKRGEVVGIIGRNGAGKSTLLKILSRITEPTSGMVDIYGRVASLLEVGTGFHPELTGRENVFLNGAILGMRREEIVRKFDEIVAFAEVERFIDTPVKFYSSGMYMRLAFAVAAHLDPEILVVDEVLAVGDAQFQKKCLGKMGDVAREGRTVLFVSHSMGAIHTLCHRAIWIAQGKMHRNGPTGEIIHEYLQNSRSSRISQGVRRKTSEKVQISDAWILDNNGRKISVIPIGECAVMVLSVNCNQATGGLFYKIIIRNSDGVIVTTINSFESLGESPIIDRDGVIKIRIAQMLLIPGTYVCDASIEIYGETIDAIDSIIEFSVEASSFYMTGKYPDRNFGSFCLDCKWEFNHE